MRSFRSMVMGFLAVVLLACWTSEILAKGSDSKQVGNAVPVHIYRDNFGVPHIYSSRAEGLFYGYG
jgi:acyl-homoserine lactone acylase PvdQ